jgi:hypothetical protein
MRRSDPCRKPVASHPNIPKFHVDSGMKLERDVCLREDSAVLIDQLHNGPTQEGVRAMIKNTNIYQESLPRSTMILVVGVSASAVFESRTIRVRILFAFLQAMRQLVQQQRSARSLCSQSKPDSRATARSQNRHLNVSPLFQQALRNSFLASDDES